MRWCSQVLALLSDTGRRGQTLLSVPKHSQTSQEARKTRFDWSQVQVGGWRQRAKPLVYLQPIFEQIFVGEGKDGALEHVIAKVA